MDGHPEGERYKRMNLGEFATGYGYAVFFSVHAAASGSIFDFVMHREHCGFAQALDILRNRGGIPFPAVQPPAIPRPRPIPRDRAALAAQWQRMRPYSGGYLEGRGLDAATIALAADRLRTDERGNTVFRHDDRDGLTGWEVKNRGFTGFAAGGRKALFACRTGITREAEPPRVAVAESALDVLSFHQANPAPALLLSFAGGLSPEQEALLRQTLTRYPAAEIVAATDADEQGEAFAALILAHRPDAARARPPTGKDWNDALRPPEARQEAGAASRRPSSPQSRRGPPAASERPWRRCPRPANVGRTKPRPGTQGGQAMTGTRGGGRPQQLKNTAREALANARTRRLEGKRHQADAELRRAAEARQTLIDDYKTPALERELLQNIEGSDFLSDMENPQAVRRRGALLAHLCNFGKGSPEP